jgi:hypothetical protein
MLIAVRGANPGASAPIGDAPRRRSRHRCCEEGPLDCPEKSKLRWSCAGVPVTSPLALSRSSIKCCASSPWPLFSASSQPEGAVASPCVPPRSPPSLAAHHKRAASPAMVMVGASRTPPRPPQGLLQQNARDGKLIGYGAQCKNTKNTNYEETHKRNRSHKKRLLVINFKPW